MKIWDNFQQHFGNAFRLVLREIEGSTGREAWGTCTVFSDDAVRFVVTAQHVVKRPPRTYVTVPGEDTFPWPSAHSVLQPVSTGVPDADVAWARAVAKDEDTSLAGGIPIGLAQLRVPISSELSYLAVGFPSSKAKVRHGAAQSKARLMLAAVQLASVEVSKSLGLDDRVHCAFTYKRDVRLDLDGRQLQGAEPHGMSGGVVLALFTAGPEQSGTPPIPVIVGILTEYHEKCEALVATRVEHWLRAIGYDTSSGDALYVRGVA